MKTCTKCKKDKDLTEFSRKKSNSDLFYSWCKHCLCSHNRTTYKERKQQILNALNLKECNICGYDKCIASLHFHHTDNNKEFTISGNQSLKRSIEEAKKCILVCANCHGEIHYLKSI